MIAVCGLRKNMAVIVMDLQEKFSGAGEVGKGRRTIQIINMMELVGKTDRLNKIRFPQSKKRRLRGDTTMLDRWNCVLNQQISEKQNYPNLPLAQSLQELDSVKVKGSILYIVGGNSMSTEVVTS